MVRMIRYLVFNIGSCGDHAAVQCGSRNASCIHQSHAADLALTGFAAFAVREVPGCMAKRQAVVRGYVACAEAGTAEARLNYCAGLQQFAHSAYLRKLKAYRNACRIYVQREVAVSAALILKNRGSLVDVIEKSARAACDYALVGVNLAVLYLIRQMVRNSLELRCSFLLDAFENLLRICRKFMNRVGVRRMERKRDHGFRLRKIDCNQAVIVSAVGGCKLLVALCAAVGLIEAFGNLIGFPDRTEACGFGGHNVDAVTEINRKVLNAGADKFEHAVLYEAVRERSLNKRKGNVMRADAALRLTGHIYENNLGHIKVPGVLKKLLYKLRAAFADAHRAERAVTGMGIGAEDHIAACGKLLTCVGVNDALVRGNIDAAEFLRCGKTEYVVILIDGAAYRAKGIVAVGHRVGEREFLKSAGASRLNNADIGDIVAHHGVKSYL